MFVNVNGIDVYYEKAGGGRPFLLLHANGESHKRYKKLAEELSREYTVYMPDARGHGHSTKTEKLSYGDIAKDTAAFIEALGIEKPIVLGASDGAITGLMLAIKHPDLLSGLIACGVNTQTDQTEKWFLAVIRIAYFISRDKRIKMMLTGPDISMEELARIKIPTLILAGSFDVIRSASTLEIAAAIPGSEVKILKGQTHRSYLRTQKIIIDAIRPFLARVTTS